MNKKLLVGIGILGMVVGIVLISGCVGNTPSHSSETSSKENFDVTFTCWKDNSGEFTTLQVTNRVQENLDACTLSVKGGSSFYVYYLHGEEHNLDFAPGEEKIFGLDDFSVKNDEDERPSSFYKYTLECNKGKVSDTCKYS